MIFLEQQPKNFCWLGLQLNRLVDQGEWIKKEEMYKMIENETVITWLEERCPYVSMWDEEDKKIVAAELFSLANATDSEKDWGINDNGILLLLAYCFALIINPPSRTIADVL